MAKVKTKKSTSYKYDAGKYKAHCTDYEQREGKQFENKPVEDMIIWKFDIENPTLNGKKAGDNGFGTITCTTSLTLSDHPKCKMTRLLRALGMELNFDNEVEIDLDEAIGRTCMVLISDDENNSDFSKIIDFVKE